jgi:hypothetical protein
VRGSAPKNETLPKSRVDAETCNSVARRRCFSTSRLRESRMSNEEWRSHVAPQNRIVKRRLDADCGTTAVRDIVTLREAVERQ